MMLDDSRISVGSAQRMKIDNYWDILRGIIKNGCRLSTAAASTAFGRSGRIHILAWVLLEDLLAAWRAEVVGLFLIIALELGRLLIDGHLAHWINRHFP